MEVESSTHETDSKRGIAKAVGQDDRKEALSIVVAFSAMSTIWTSSTSTSSLLCNEGPWYDSPKLAGSEDGRWLNDQYMNATFP